jgi:transposase
MRELSVVEQRYQAVLAVLSDGETVTDVAGRFGVRRQTVHEWLARYEGGGLDALVDRSHRPRSCPHQMATVAEVAVLELRRSHPSWGPRRLHFELSKRELESLPRFWLSRYPPMESGRTDPSPGHQQVALTEQPCQP